MALWTVGLGLAVLACAFNAMGYVFQRRGHFSIHNKCPWLIGGLTFLLLGGLLDFASLGFAAQSLVAATGGLTLVCNVIFAKWILDEPVSSKVCIGTVVVVIGCGVTVAFSSHHSESRNGDELEALLKEPTSIVYFILVNSLLLLSVMVICIMENSYFAPKHQWYLPCQPKVDIESISTQGLHRSARRASCGAEGDDQCDSPEIQRPSACCIDPATIVPPTLTRVVTPPGNEPPSAVAGSKDGLIRPWKPGMSNMNIVNLHGAMHAWISGIAGSQSVLFGKICAEILVSSSKDDEGPSFNFAVFFSSLVAMGLYVWLQLHAMNRGLKFHQTVLIIPAYQTFWTLGGIASGAAIFGEFDNASVLALCAYPVGMLVMLSGVWLLIMSQQSTQLTGHAHLQQEGMDAPEAQMEGSVDAPIDGPTKADSAMPDQI